MKNILLVFLFINSTSFAQMTIADAKLAAGNYKLGTYSYHEQFIGHAGYGAPIILTSEGGTAFFGDDEIDGKKCGTLVKLDKAGKEEWKLTIKPQFDDIESQSVIQDKLGNFYVCMISYDNTRYRGGSERILYISKTGKIAWDKTIGKYSLMNNPVISYLRLTKDGQICLRGHSAVEKPEEGKDPKYRFWEGFMNAKGILTQKTGDIIDWSNSAWENYYKPE